MTRSGVVTPITIDVAVILTVGTVMIVASVELAGRLVAIGNEGVPLVVARTLAESHFRTVTGRTDSTRCPATSAAFTTTG